MGSLLCVKRATPESTPSSYQDILNRYEGRCDWLKDDEFLRDLESDSVDSEILDEELRSLEAKEPNTCQRRANKTLDSSAVQIAMCVLVMLDAGIVVAEILLDLQATRVQSTETAYSLARATDFIRDRFAGQLINYTDADVEQMIDLINQGDYAAVTTATITVVPEASGHAHHVQNDVSAPSTNANAVLLGRDYRDNDRWHLKSAANFRLPAAAEQADNDRRVDGTDRTWSPSLKLSITELPLDDPVADSNGKRSGRARNRKQKRDITDAIFAGEDRLSTVGYDANHKAKLSANERYTISDLTSAMRVKPDDDDRAAFVDGNGPTSRDVTTSTLERSRREPEARARNVIAPETTVTLQPEGSTYSDESVIYPFPADFSWFSALQSSNLKADANLHRSNGVNREAAGHHRRHGYTASLIKAGHVLHYSSIAILGVFVIQVCVKIIATGAHYFKQKLEVFDGAVIIASFLLDIGFIDGVIDNEGEHAAAVILIFLLWRILRIVNGLLIADKKRQEFRIKLQKRTRMRLEKKVEGLREDNEWHMKHTINLKTLCLDKGITEEELVMCRPRRRTVVQTATMTGLSTIASLSVGLSMSMSGSNNVTITGLPTSCTLETVTGSEDMLHRNSQHHHHHHHTNSYQLEQQRQQTVAAAPVATVSSRQSVYGSSAAPHQHRYQSGSGKVQTPSAASCDLSVSTALTDTEMLDPDNSSSVVDEAASTPTADDVRQIVAHNSQVLLNPIELASPSDRRKSPTEGNSDVILQAIFDGSRGVSKHC